MTSLRLPDFPAEIRAPAGSLPGVSGFQLNFSSQDIKTPGDQPSVLVAMNPAALKVNLADLEEGGTLIINTDGFTPENLKYANYASNPLEDGTLAGLSRAQAAGHHAQHERAEGQRRTVAQGDRSLQKLLRARVCSTGSTIGRWKIP